MTMKVDTQVVGKASGETEFRADRATVIAAGVATAAFAFYLTVFVRSAMYDYALPLMAGDTWRLRGMLVVLSVGAVGGGIWAAWRFQVLNLQASLSWSFRGCGAGAALVLGGAVWPVMLMGVLLSGLSIGALAVSLISSLRPVAGTAALGQVVGGGWAAALIVAQVLSLIGANPKVFTIIAAVVAAGASVASPFLAPSEPSMSPENHYLQTGILRWLPVLGLLGAFSVTGMIGVVGGAGVLAGLLQAVAALGAGLWWSRGGRWSLALAALGLLLLGAAAPRLGTELAGFATWLTAAGTGLGAVVLICWPARSGRAFLVAITWILGVWLAGGAVQLATSGW